MRIKETTASPYHQTTEYQTEMVFIDEEGDREVTLSLAISIEHFMSDDINPETCDIFYDASSAKVVKGSQCEERYLTGWELREFCSEHDQDIIDHAFDNIHE